MEPALRSELVRLSAEFYEFHAASFDRSRQQSWESWTRILDEVSALIDVRRVIDLGCGNGRFAKFLLQQNLPEVSYLGVDTSPQLIESARQEIPQLEFMVRTIESAISSLAEYDLAVAFGVLHHVPGYTERGALLNSLSRVLKDDCVAVVSFWQPKRLANFDTKIKLDHGYDGLETNDYLLGWNGDFSHPRYCHHFDNSEIDDLIIRSPFREHARFAGTANDATNIYTILRR